MFSLKSVLVATLLLEGLSVSISAVDSTYV